MEEIKDILREATMDYALSEQQQAFRETAMRFAKEKLAPYYQKRAT